MNAIDKMKIHDAVMTVMNHNVDDGILLSDSLNHLNDLMRDMKQKYLPNEINQYMINEYGWEVSE